MIRWIKTVRTINGLDQEELAQHIGRSRSAVGMYESGERVVPPEVIASIISAFPGTPSPPTGDFSIRGQVIGEDRLAAIRYAGSM